MIRRGKGILVLVAVIILSACSFFGSKEKVPARNNVALGKDVTASTFREPYPPENAVDGEISKASRWLTGTTSEGGNGDPPHWLEIDLAGTYTIDSAEIWTGDPESATNWGIEGYKLQYKDGDDWIDIPGALVEDKIEHVFLTFDEPVTVDHVRFWSLDNSIPIRVVEIAIYEVLSDED